MERKKLSNRCILCGINFSRYRNLWRHNRTVHSDADAEVFECAVCGRKFTRKDSLRRHLETHVSIKRICKSGKIYECFLCGITFTSYKKFWMHKRSLHPNNNERKFECFMCNGIFNQKNDIQKHIFSQHLTFPKRITLYTHTCVLCCETFHKRKDILSHLEIEHKVKLETEILEFENENDFNAWKTLVEKQTYCSYRKKDNYKSNYKIRRVYECSRSGYHFPKYSPKRRLKLQGSKKINGYCPSRMCFTINSDGTGKVEYLKTHVGHATDIKQLPYMGFSFEEKNTIVEKVAKGIPVSEIINEMTGSCIPSIENAEKIHLLNRKDVWNIAKSRNLNVTYSKRSRRKIPHNVIDIESWLSRNSDSVLFFKNQGENDVSRFGLSECDFVLVTMTKEQTSVLQNYATKAIILECSQHVNKKPADFLLFSVLIQDSIGEGYGCCFMITNRNDQLAVSVMFACIRQKIGAVRTQVFMSDSRSLYFDTWVSVMESEPEFHLFCPWHIIKEWEQNFSRAPVPKRKELKELILALLHERDVDAFHLQLIKFLQTEDEELQSFIVYFAQKFGANYKNWAFCYRPHTSLNANMSMESFHSTFKYIHNSGLTIRQVQDTLNILDMYLKTKHRDHLRTEIYGGKYNYKIMTSRSNHDKAKLFIADSAVSHPEIKTVSKNVWLVPSTSSQDITYTIEKVNETCESNCPLLCLDCQFCSHQFTCTCRENTLKSIMCKHIHRLCLTNMLNIIELDENESCNNLVENETCAYTEIETCTTYADGETCAYADNETGANLENETCAGIDEEKYLIEEVIPISVEKVSPSDWIRLYNIQDDRREEKEVTEMISRFSNIVKAADEKKRQYLKRSLSRLETLVTSFEFCDASE